MKKILGIVALCLLLSGNVMAKVKNIGNGLSINIPDNYKYFEITFKQLVSRFPEITSNEQIYDDFGIGIDAKLIVIANKQKTIKFFDDVTSISGLEKLNRKHLQPILKKIEDPKFLEVIMKDLQKFSPNADFENMSEEEAMELVEKALENPKILKLCHTSATIPVHVPIPDQYLHIFYIVIRNVVIYRSRCRRRQACGL